MKVIHKLAFVPVSRIRQGIIRYQSVSALKCLEGLTIKDSMGLCICVNSKGHTGLLTVGDRADAVRIEIYSP